MKLWPWILGAVFPAALGLDWRYRWAARCREFTRRQAARRAAGNTYDAAARRLQRR